MEQISQVDKEFLFQNNSMQVFYIHSENTLYFKGNLNNSDEHILGSLFRKIKKIIFFHKKLRLNLKELKSMPHSGVALFYQLVKIRLNESIYFLFITSKKMKWQQNWLKNIEHLSYNAGNQSQINYQQ